MDDEDDDEYEEYEDTKEVVTIPSSAPAADVSPQMAEAMKTFPQWTQEQIQGYFDKGGTFHPCLSGSTVRSDLRMTRGWSTASWEDPDGGTILLGTFPTVVIPRSLWPNPKAWHGLALLDDAGAPEAWSQEEEDERASPGVNLEALGLALGMRRISSMPSPASKVQ